MRGIFGVGLAVALAFAACGGAPPPPPTTTMTLPANTGAAPVNMESADASTAPSVAAASSNAPDASAKPRLCGCSLCEPAFSDDTCSADADCAPSTACHAAQCVAKAKAVTRKPGEMCSMIMVCSSADANACGCLKGKCALSPRK